MEFSDDIEEESPCFIVPNSQSESEQTAQRCDLNIGSSLKGLAMLRSPSLPGVGMSKNTSSDQEHDQHSDRNTDSSVSMNSNEREYKSQSSIPEKATESSSSESPHPNSTSTSSGTSSSDDSGLKVKMHALKNVRSNNFFSSTPDANFSTAVSSYNTVNKQVAHLTPLEGTTDTPSGEILAKDTSSSDCAEESTRSLHREIIATSSSEDAVSSSFEELKPSSSSSDGEKPKPIQSTVLESNCSEERPVSECQTDTSLPKWQQDCLPEGMSSVESVGDVTRTLSTNSTSNKSSLSVNEESSPHQWQSQQSSSDELFESSSETTNLQVSSSLQAPNQKSCFTLPELSQDIFHHRTKGLSDDPTVVHQEPSPTDNDVIPPSQEDNAFRLYITQSQSSNAPSQIRSRPDAEHEKQLVAATSYESVDTPHAVSSQSILAQVSAKPRDNNQTEEQHWVRNFFHPETDKQELGKRDEQHCIVILESPPLIETDKEPESQDEQQEEEPTEKDKQHCIGNLPQDETDDEPELRERDEPPCIEILETPPLVVETDKEPELDEKDKHCIGGNLPQDETDEEPELRERDEQPCIEILETPPLVVETDEEPELHEKDKYCIGNLPQVETDDEPEFDENNGKPEHIRVSSPDCKQATFTESAESSHVAFHFSPPNFLLRPMLTIAPSPCHETSFESQIESLNESSHEEIETTSEFESVLPEVPATTLSLSAPVPYDGNSENDVDSDVAFNLQKEDLVSDAERRTEVITKPARSIFTNIRERFQTSAVREFDEEQDPFEFRDEIHNLPSGKRRRIDERKDVALHEDLGRNNEERAGTKRRLDDGDLEECLGKRRKGNIKPGAVIDVDDPESDKEMNKSKPGIWKVLKIRTITTTSTMVEREMLAIYSNYDGEVLKRVTTHEFEEPTYATKACDSEQPRVRVEDLPDQTSPRNNKENLVIHPKKNTKSGTGQRSRVETKTQRTNKRSVSAGRQRALRKSSEDHVTSEVETVQEGSRVLAKWFDKCYYPGTLISKNGTDSKYRVVFDDGDSRFIRRQDILVVDYLPRDQPVMFRQEHEDCYDNGVIRGFYQTRNEKGYKVVQEDGNGHKCSRSRVILDVEQAAIFLSLESSNSSKGGDGRTSQASPISSSRVMTSLEQTDAVRSSPHKSSALRPNVSTTSPEKATRTSRTSLEKATSKSRTSLEKATSKSRTSPEKATKKSRTSPEKATKKSRTSQDKATSSSRKSHDKVTKQNDDDGKDFAKKPSSRKSETKPQSLSSSETPKSSHKSTAKEVRNQSGNEDTGIHAGRRTGKVRQRLCTALNKAESIPTRASPRKLITRKDSQVNDENLILPTNKDLFRGYGFVITGSDVNHVSGDENSPREEDHTNFNRGQVIRQVEVGGGVILDNFNENSNSEVLYILISNSYQTTVKYFYALVAGVPCLSHVWVRDCCNVNKLIGYESYLLPAGRDLITGGLVEKQKCIGALREMKVYLVADDDFKAKWQKVLSAAGCQLVIKLPTNVVKQLQYENQDCKCDVIVVGSGHVSHSTILKARLLSIPTVTIHWLKQSILTGTCVAFNAHPSFTYRAVQAEK